MNNRVSTDVFQNVYGYKDVKRELIQIRNWLTNEDYLNNKDIMLPKGILFYGSPGNGKTSLLKEYAYSFNCPVFVIEGEKKDKGSEELMEMFKKAKKEKFSIIVVDEIDLFLNSSRKVQRILQDELDGINTAGRFLVLATTNDIDEIPSVLTRPGRFDRLIEIDDPDFESRKDLFNNFIIKLNGSDEMVDYNHVAKTCSNCSGAEIKAICNDVLLRCGLEFSTDEIEKSYRRIVKRDLSNNSSKFKNYRAAIHEAGHALMTLNFKDNWSFYNAQFTKNGGEDEIQEVDEKIDTVCKRGQFIMIKLGGYIAEEIIFGQHDVGSFGDYCSAQELCENLIGKACIDGIKNLSPLMPKFRSRIYSQAKLSRFEKKVVKLLKKYERKTKTYLRKCKDKLKNLATKMLNDGELTYKTITQNEVKVFANSVLDKEIITKNNK